MLHEYQHSSFFSTAESFDKMIVKEHKGQIPMGSFKYSQESLQDEKIM